MKQLITDGWMWKESIHEWDDKKWESECGNFEILRTAKGKYRLISFLHDPSPEFPQLEFWMREFSSLEQAAEQAEMM